MRKIAAVRMVIVLLLIGMSLYTATIFAQESPIHRLELGVELYDLGWSPDGRLLAVATSAGVQVLSNSLEEVTTLHSHEDNVFSVAWNPDGTQLASAGGREADSIQIWNYDSATTSFQHEQGFSIDAAAIISIEWSPDSTKLVSLAMVNSTGGVRGAAQVWDMENWIPLRSRPYYLEEPGCILTWSPDSRSFAVQADNGIHVVNISTSENSYYLNFGYPRLNDCTRAASWSSKDELAIALGELQIFDGSNGQPLFAWDVYGAWRPRWSPDGENLLVSVFGRADGTVGDGILNIDTGTLLYEFDAMSLTSAADWSPDGSLIVTGSQDGVIEVWDVSNFPDVSSIPTLTPLPTLTPSYTPTPTATPVAS